MGETQVQPVIFSASQDVSSDELGGSMPVATNVVVDMAGSVRARPGIAAWSGFNATLASGSPVIGMVGWGQYLIYVTQDRNIWALPTLGDPIALTDANDITTRLDGGERPSFVAGREMVVIAGGGAMQKWTGSGLSARLTNTGAGGDPPEANHICGIAQRLVAAITGKTGQLWWTGPLEEYENWDMATGGASYIQAAAKPDPIVAMGDNTNEVYAFGTETIQVYAPANLAVDANDANNILDFAPARTMNLGLGSRNAFCATDDTWAVLDRFRRIVVTDARSYNDISKQIAKELLDFGDIDDAWAFRMRFGRFDCLVFMFPSEGKGLIWSANSGNWSEWRAWNAGATPVTITSAYHWAEQDAFLVGLSDGSIAQLDEDAVTDLGNPIVIELVSGFTTHGSTAQKACNTLMLNFRRSLFRVATSAFARLWMRDDLGVWEHVADIPISPSPQPCEQVRSLGVYRARQWKLQYAGSDGFSFVSAQEEFETLGA
jgi:hypothetical protein